MTNKIIVDVYTGVTPTVEHYYSFTSEKFEVEPVKIVRKNVTSKFADDYYYCYEFEFVGRNPMIDVNQRPLAGSIVRSYVLKKHNPDWEPPKDGWINNIWTPGNELKASSDE